MPHLDTHSDHSSSAQVLKEAAVAGYRKKEERGVLLNVGYSLLFGSLSWHCIGYLY